MSVYNTITLRSGLRVIHRHTQSPVVYCGFQVAVGTRNEQKGEEGLAHFCEHMIFKGTMRRHAMQIIKGLEVVGGDLNAFTTKDTTVFHAAILNEHLPKAVNLLSDIVFRSIFPPAEIEKEVEVVCDEIESYNDSPAELIYDEFERWLFPNHPLGHNILGNAEQLHSYKQDDFLRFHRRFYRPERTVFFVDGDVDFDRIVKMLRRQGFDSASEFAEGKRYADDIKLVEIPEFDTACEKTRTIVHDTHQAHVMIGCRAYKVGDKRRLPLYLLNNMIGGPGMSARLNIVLRERRALVYAVESYMMSYSDTGMWASYFGCEPKNVEKCCSLVRKELKRYAETPLSSSNLLAAKRQIKGQIGIACDQREQFALDCGKSFLHYGWERNIEKLYKDIDAITAKEVQEVAADLFTDDNLLTLIIK